MTRVRVRILAVCFPVAFVSLIAGIAFAKTPTPTATPTVTATPSPSPMPTPRLPPEQVAKFSGKIWIDAFGGYDRAGIVSVRIGDTVCGRPGPGEQSGGFPVDPPPLTISYSLDVVPQEAKPGCGYEGATVTFFVGDRQADQTATWHAGSSQVMNLSAGPPVAYFHGRVTLPPRLDPSLFQHGPLGMYAYINDNLCGEVGPGGIWPNFPYEEVVKSAEEQQGCGVEGAEVTFKLHDREGHNLSVARNILGVAREKGVWHAWGQGNVGQELDLTMAPVGSSITPGNVGDGSTQRSGAAPWAELPIGLSVLGLFGVATAVALRRRAAAR